MTTHDITGIIKQLVAIPSTADNPAGLRQALDVLAAMAAACPNVHVERFTQNGRVSFVAYKGTQRPAPFDVLLTAHLDVVPGTPAQFQPVIKNGKLYGRGALDMKGTATALTSVFCTMVNQVPYALGLQIVTDEEIGGYDGARLQIQQGVRPRLAIIGEYANDAGVIYHQARGICWVALQFDGVAAHGGHPWHGSNALMRASDFAQEVLRRYPTPAQETWTTTANIASIATTNETFNRVPDSAVLKIDFRFTPEATEFRDTASLTALLHSIDPAARILDIPIFEQAVHLDPGDPYLQALAAVYTDVYRTPARLLWRPAGSDARHFAMVGSKVIEVGLTGNGQHGDDEYVELQSIAPFTSSMCSFLTGITPQIQRDQQNPFRAASRTAAPMTASRQPVAVA